MTRFKKNKTGLTDSLKIPILKTDSLTSQASLLLLSKLYSTQHKNNI